MISQYGGLSGLRTLATAICSIVLWTLMASTLNQSSRQSCQDNQMVKYSFANNNYLSFCSVTYQVVVFVDSRVVTPTARYYGHVVRNRRHLFSQPAITARKIIDQSMKMLGHGTNRTVTSYVLPTQGKMRVPALPIPWGFVID